MWRRIHQWERLQGAGDNLSRKLGSESTVTSKPKQIPRNRDNLGSGDEVFLVRKNRWFLVIGELGEGEGVVVGMLNPNVPIMDGIG